MWLHLHIIYIRLSSTSTTSRFPFGVGSVVPLLPHRRSARHFPCLPYAQPTFAARGSAPSLGPARFLETARNHEPWASTSTFHLSRTINHSPSHSRTGVALSHKAGIHIRGNITHSSGPGSGPGYDHDYDNDTTSGASLESPGALWSDTLHTVRPVGRCSTTGNNRFQRYKQ